MKLLLDHHISHKLLRSIDDLFPNSLHVWQAGLDRASDKSILDFAYERGYIVMTKDADFQDLYRSYTPPVKVIWLKIGNSNTQTLTQKLRDYFEIIHSFYKDDSIYLLELY